jgi:hypothetical protein
MSSRLPRWIPLFVGFTSCCLLALIADTPHVLGALRPPTRLSGVLALRNTTWDSVRVELRLGPSTQCDVYPSLAVRTLKRGETWAVVVDQVVCWRREASPGAAPLVWGAWQSRPMPSTGVDNVAL